MSGCMARLRGGGCGHSAPIIGLLVAVQEGNLDQVKGLVEGGANVRETDENGETLTHMAAAKGHLDILQYFVEKKGAGLVHKAGGYNAFTPLHNACSGGHLACVKYLMSVGANPEARDMDGWTVRRTAKEKGKAEVVAWLDAVKAAGGYAKWAAAEAKAKTAEA